MRYSHLGDAELVRPEKDLPWQLKLHHDAGMATLAEAPALRVAGKMLATLNVGVASASEVQHAIAKLDEAGDPEGYFTRVASLAMRTSWGRFPDAVAERDAEPKGSVLRASGAAAGESIVLGTRRHGQRRPDAALPAARRSTVSRSRWRRTRTSSAARCSGELESLHAAWKDAEEIAAIADELFADDVLDEFKRQYYDRIAASDASS